MLDVPSMEGLGHVADSCELLVVQQRDLNDGVGTIVPRCAPNSTPLPRRRPQTDHRPRLTQREVLKPIETDSDRLSWHLG